MNYDEAVWQAIQVTLAKKHFASESKRNAVHRPGKKVVIGEIEYQSATMAALSYNADPVYVCRYTRSILKNPTGKKKDGSKRKGNTNRGKTVIVKRTDGCEEKFRSMKEFAESRGYKPESVREDHRNGMTFEEIDRKHRRLLDEQSSKVVDGILFKTEKEICDYLRVTRQTLSRLHKKGYNYQEIASHCRKLQSKHDDILNFRICDNVELLHIIDLARELPEKIIALKETDSIYVICPECKNSHSVSVRKIKSYAVEHNSAPLCNTCAIRKSLGEDVLYHGMLFPSQRKVLQLKGIEKMAPRITSLTKDGKNTFEEAVDILVEEKLHKERKKKRGYRDEFEATYDEGYRIIDYVDIEQCTHQGINLSEVRVDKKIPLKCPKCDSKINPMQLRYLVDRKPLCPKCDDVKKDTYISSYDAVAYIVMASRVLCEYQKEVKYEGGICYVDISVIVDNRNVAIEIDGNFYHKNIENDIRKTDVLLSNGYDLVIRLRENNVDGSALPDVPNAINYHFPNNPFKSKKSTSIFASNLTESLRHLGVQMKDVNVKDVQEAKQKLPQNLTIGKVLDISVVHD